MRLTSAELTKLASVLEKIDLGSPPPRVAGRLGRFFRQYATGRERIAEIIQSEGVAMRSDGAISGRGLDQIALHPLASIDVRILGFPLAEVGETPAICEELGSVIELVLWLKGPIANGVYNLLRSSDQGVAMEGDYRWTPTNRLTPGEAQCSSAARRIGWWDARCLKATSDDLARPPHAREYLLDWKVGRPGLKCFRCTCARRLDETWQVLPGFDGTHVTISAGVSTPGLSQVPVGGLALVLVCREPWESRWVAVEGIAVEPDSVLSHSVTWADFQLEMKGEPIDASTIEDARRALRACEIVCEGIGSPNLDRRLLPTAHKLLQWLRGQD